MGVVVVVALETVVVGLERKMAHSRCFWRIVQEERERGGRRGAAFVFL